MDIRARTRRAATKRRYAMPAAWDNIDDPHETPSLARYDTKHSRSRHKSEIDYVVIQRVLDGEKMHTTQAERPIILGRWLASGRSEKALCDLLGWKAGRAKPADLTDYDEAV